MKLYLDIEVNNKKKKIVFIYQKERLGKQLKMKKTKLI